MKNLLILLVAIFSLQAFADKGPVGRSNSLDALGAEKGPKEQWFINVKNVSGGALLDGDVVVSDLTADDGYSVNTTATAGFVPMCVLAEACADDESCKCQTYGYKSNVNFDAENGSSVAGKMAFISELTAGSVEYEASPAATDYAIGEFLDVVAATGDAEMFIRLK